MSASKVIHAFGVILLAVGPFLSLFGDMPLSGLGMWVAGILLQIAAARYVPRSHEVSDIICFLGLVLGIFGLVHNQSFSQFFYGVITALVMSVAH